MRHFDPGDIIAPREHLKDWLSSALRVSSVDGDGTIHASRLGMILVYTFDPISVEEYDFVKVPSKLLNSPNWESTDFYADWFEKNYRGWSNGLRWNGWAMPYFEFDEAMRYARDSQEGGPGPGSTTYDPARDAFITQRDDPEDNEIDEATVILVKGHGAIKVYPIGAGSWRWSVARKEKADEDEDEA